MSVTPSQRIASPFAVGEKQYLSRHGESFVETVDTNNNVSVRTETDTNPQFNQNIQHLPKEEHPPVKADTPMVSNTIAALAASGVLEEEIPQQVSSNVDVYSRNQSTIREEERDRKGHRYLKHFYEQNQPVEEINKFI